MSWIEDMAISVVLGLIQQFVKNPSKKAAAEALLLHVADSVYESYGIVPPAHS